MNTRGEVFAAESREDAAALRRTRGARGGDGRPLPRLVRGVAPAVAAPVARCGCRRAAAGACKAVGADGALTLELGRDEPDARLARFVAAHRQTLARAGARGHQGRGGRPALSQRLCGARAGVPRKEHAKPAEHDRDAMKDNKNLIVGLDIGTSKIVAIVAEVGADGDAQRDRARHAAVARAQERRGGQHRSHDGLDPARAGGGRADGRLPDQGGLHRHRGQPHPLLHVARHGGDQGKGSDAGGHRPRGRDRQGDPDPQRPADPAHRAAVVHDRRPGRRARAARHERRAPRGRRAHRDRRGVRGRERDQVHPPLRARRARRDPAAARVGDRGAVRRREGAGRLPHRHRRRHDGHRGATPAARSGTRR